MPLRRDRSYVESFASGYGEEMAEVFPPGSRRRPGVRLSLRGGLIPRTVWGRVAAGGALILILGAIAGGTMWARSFLLSDEHFTISNSAAIQIAGNSHLTNAQLLSVFGGDVDRNIFRIPLDQRRAELESLPWVAHATVMRLLPNRIRVGIVERTPVAFVRNGTKIGLVDSNGVLFDVPDPQPENGLAPHYSFPVLTGISPDDPLSTRSARVRLYLEFMAGLDAGGEAISKQVSEVDLSYPDDVKAIVADSNSHTNLLVHFGSSKYLDRYHQYQQHLGEWKTQCPRLASVDMRYEQQVVLEPCTAAPEATATAAVERPVPIIPVLHSTLKAKPPVRHKPLLKVNGKAKRAAHGAAR